jgi:hypothetical protein
MLTFICSSVLLGTREPLDRVPRHGRVNNAHMKKLTGPAPLQLFLVHEGANPYRIALRLRNAPKIFLW